MNSIIRKTIQKQVWKQMSRIMTKPTKWHVRPAKTQISLGVRPVWSESSLFAWRKLGSLATHWARSEDSDQSGRMPRLIWVFAGRTLILLVLSCRGSNEKGPYQALINENTRIINKLKIMKLTTIFLKSLYLYKGGNYILVTNICTLNWHFENLVLVIKVKKIAINSLVWLLVI